MGYSAYPNNIDNSSQLPIVTDLITPVRAEVINRHRDAIIAIEAELGIKPSGTYGSVRARLDTLENTLETGGAFTAGGDLNGTTTIQHVIGIQGISIDPTPPIAGQILLATTTAYAQWMNNIISLTFATVSSSAPLGTQRMLDLTQQQLDSLTDGQIVYTKSFRCHWEWQAANSSTPDNITICQPTIVSGNGRFIRKNDKDLYWNTVSSWFIDPINGNDENDPGDGLRTLDEFSRRFSGPAMQDISIDVGGSDVYSLGTLNLDGIKSGQYTVRFTGSNYIPALFQAVSFIYDVPSGGSTLNSVVGFPTNYSGSATGATSAVLTGSDTNAIVNTTNNHTLRLGYIFDLWGENSFTINCINYNVTVGGSVSKVQIMNDLNAQFSGAPYRASVNGSNQLVITSTITGTVSNGNGYFTNSSTTPNSIPAGDPSGTVSVLNWNNYIGYPIYTPNINHPTTVASSWIGASANDGTNAFSVGAISNWMTSDNYDGTGLQSNNQTKENFQILQYPRIKIGSFNTSSVNNTDNTTSKFIFEQLIIDGGEASLFDCSQTYNSNYPNPGYLYFKNCSLTGNIALRGDITCWNCFFDGAYVESGNVSIWGGLINKTILIKNGAKVVSDYWPWSVSNKVVFDGHGRLETNGLSVWDNTSYGNVIQIHDGGSVNQFISPLVAGGSVKFGVSSNLHPVWVSNLSFPYNRININTSTYQIPDWILNARYKIIYAGNCTITLPVNPIDGEQLIFKDSLGQAGGNVYTLSSGSGKTIDGSSSFIFPIPYTSITIIYDLAATNWEII